MISYEKIRPLREKHYNFRKNVIDFEKLVIAGRRYNNIFEILLKKYKIIIKRKPS
jgi:hypothetical protein